jgi:hypothetical protein
MRHSSDLPGVNLCAALPLPLPHPTHTPWSGVGVGVGVNVVRLLRVPRVLRLIRGTRSLRVLFNALLLSLPSLWNIGLLLFVVAFMFAVLGEFDGVIRGALGPPNVLLAYKSNIKHHPIYMGCAIQSTFRFSFRFRCVPSSLLASEVSLCFASLLLRCRSKPLW